MSNSSQSGAGTLFVISTSHMDWDWATTFDDYYYNGWNGNSSVQSILSEMITLMQTTPTAQNPIPYKYNLAEIAWLKKYIEENPNQVSDLPALLATFQDRLYFLGGGFTSPDNLICNGELFIRNYLVGRNYVKSVGLGALLSDVCWIPDDFGHDPQLPVVLCAMGMKGVSFARLPGEQPTSLAGPTKYKPKTVYTPLNGSASLSDILTTEGVAFRWMACDDSTIFSQYMFDTAQNPAYGVIWNQSNAGTTGSGDSWQVLYAYFQESMLMQPNHPVFMAACGGDFSQPNSLLCDSVNDFNNNTGPDEVARMGTFEDFISEFNPDTLGYYPNENTLFDPSNYWTGHFSSRVQLKIDQQVAVNELLAAEMLTAILQASNTMPRQRIVELMNAIDDTWLSLAPSSHHDYITGTSGDTVYETEQLPLLQQALGQAMNAIQYAMELLAAEVNAKPVGAEIPFVVYNPSGLQRSVGFLAEFPGNGTLNNANSYRKSGETLLRPIQRLSDGTIVLPMENIESASYDTVYFSTLPPADPEPLNALTWWIEPNGDYTFRNAALQFTVDSTQGWAINSAIDLLNNDTEVFVNGNLGNQVFAYDENFYIDNEPEFFGNIYQMGNEFNNAQLGTPVTNADLANGFAVVPDSCFTISGDGSVIEAGPYCIRFSCVATNNNNESVTIIYELQYNEPMIRISVTGQVTNSEMSVVTRWELNDQNGNAPSYIEYGTGNHWHNSTTYNPAWNGYTFRPVHDYLTATGSDGASMAALYNTGMRSWAHEGNVILGIMFRNASGPDRGASGTDTAIHTQEFAFRMPGVGRPGTCQPLKESLAFQQSLYTQAVEFISENGVPESSVLAWSDDPRVLIRSVRVQQLGDAQLTGGTSADSSFSLIARTYQPSNRTKQTRSILFPWLRNRNATPTLVTALEEPIADAPPLEITDEILLNVPEMKTITTVQLVVY